MEVLPRMHKGKNFPRAPEAQFGRGKKEGDEDATHKHGQGVQGNALYAEDR